MKGKSDISRGILVMILAAAYFYFANQIKINAMLSTTKMDSATLPKVYGILLFLLGVIMLVRGLKANRLEQQENGETAEKQTVVQWFEENKSVVGAFAALAAYVILFDILGFVIATMLFLFVAIQLLSRKGECSIKKALVIAVVGAVVLYLIFCKGFQIPLPNGILKSLGF